MNHPLLAGVPIQAHLLLGMLSAAQSCTDSGARIMDDVEVIYTKSEDTWFTFKDIDAFAKKNGFIGAVEMMKCIDTLTKLGLMSQAVLGKDVYFSVNLNRVEELYYGGKPSK